MKLVLVTEPQEEPVTTTEQKAHSRISVSTEDSLIGNYIKAARIHAENFTNRAFITQVWKAVMDCFPTKNIKITKPPHVSVDSITYIDEDGAQQTWSSSLYETDLNGEDLRIRPIETEDYPDTDEVLNAVTVNFTSGYGAADSVPEDIKTAIKMIAGELYERRESGIVATQVNPVLLSAEMLLWKYRVLRF